MTLTGYDPAAGVVPVMVPVSAAMVRPIGSPVAENESGACPVAGIVNRNGVAGRAAQRNGACNSGVAGAGVIEMVCARRDAGERKLEGDAATREQG